VRKRRHGTSIKLNKNHSWRGTPGYKVFVADRGAVRFEFPRTWVVVDDNPDGIKFHDKKPPKDDCMIGISYLRIPPIDWTDLPLSSMVAEVTGKDSRQVTGWEPIVEARRIDLEIAWRQGRFIDSNEKRPALTRLCLARRGTVQALLTMDFWEVDLERWEPVWNHLLDSLELDEPIDDPRQGPRVM
jgi:hypothetical protein